MFSALPRFAIFVLLVFPVVPLLDNKGMTFVVLSVVWLSNVFICRW